MADVTVTVLAIGQGLSSLLEVWEGASYAKRTNLFVALMDCGSDDNKEKQNVKDSITAIQDAMNKHTNIGGFTPPYLDMLIISHQDTDHWNKLHLLFDGIKGKRQINHNGQLIDTCIQKPTEIEKLDFPSVNADILISQEQYSKFNLAAANMAIYKGSQHLVIEKQDYFMNIEWSYSELFKSNGYTMGFKIDNPYLEISLCYNYNTTSSDWNIITKTGSIQFLLNLNYKKVEETIDKNSDLHCCIGQSFIGGQEDIEQPSFKEYKDKIKALSSTEVVQLIKNQKNQEIFINTSWNLTCKILCCTTLSNCKFSGGGSNKGLKRNASSAVALWSINNTKMLYPGDATIHTMYHMRQNHLLECAESSIVLAPHHGSGKTSAKASRNTSIKRHSPDRWEELGFFLNGIQPSKIIISAGMDNGHGHPNSSFIEKSEKAFDTNNTAEHNICYNTHPSGNKDREYKEKKEQCPLYTTVVYNNFGRTEYQPHSSNFRTTKLDNGFRSNLTEDRQGIEVIQNAQALNQELIIGVEKEEEQSSKKSTINLNQLDFLDYKFGWR